MNYKFIGYNNQGQHDKVWVCVLLEDNWTKPYSSKKGNYNKNKYVVIYGRRGKTLRTKIYEHYPIDMNKIIDQKEDKRGYINIPETELDVLYPEFEDDLEQTAFWATLGLDYKR